MPVPKFNYKKEIVPKERLLSAYIVSIVFFWISVLIGTIALKQYSYSLFIFTPFINGFIFSVIINYKNKTTAGYSIRHGILSLILSLGFVLLVGAEGLICILMAFAILIPCNIIGSIAGYLLVDLLDNNNKPFIILLTVINPVLMVAENNHQKQLETVTTEVKLVVNAPVEAIWKKMVEKNEYKGFNNIFFKAGIAYPLSTFIIDKNHQKQFICHYSQGDIALPINEYIPEKRLTFLFKETPAPMRELSFYKDLHLPHLHGYFNINNGTIRIEKINEQQSTLIASTSYTYDIAPLFYWRLWTNYLLNKVHHQVLETIKTNAEKEADFTYTSTTK
jgi:hypothetical protein